MVYILEKHCMYVINSNYINSCFTEKLMNETTCVNER